MSKVYVVGIGYSVLSDLARKALISSKEILTSKRLMEVFEGYPIHQEVEDKLVIIDGVDKTLQYLREWATMKSYEIAVLASGDPMFYGIGRRIAQEIGKEHVEIIPELSCIQLAFSRIKEPWDNAFLMSVHGGPFPNRRINRYTPEDVPYFLALHGKVCVLTDPINNPNEIAKTISEYFEGEEGIRMYVAERLGYGEERVVEGRPSELVDMAFQDPNVVVVIWDGFRPNRRFGYKVSEIAHERGLITKDEIRAVIIHKLSPPQKGVVWDIGAGSGSVSLELSLLFPDLDIYAVERDLQQYHLLFENRRKTKARFRIVHGEAPKALEGLPRPDRVFVGGSGGMIGGIIEYLISKEVEVVVFAVTLFENLKTVLETIPRKSYQVEVTQLCSFSSKELKESWYLVPQNPVFVITLRKHNA